MDFRGFDDFQKFAETYGFSGFENYKSNNDDGNTNSSSNNSNFTEGCEDSGGFQQVNPQFFTVVGEIIGLAMAGNMPFNVQNAIGNWLQLVGQVILVYNAQQQYFQNGPGRLFNPKHYNDQNPFCSSTSTPTDSTGAASANLSSVNKSSSKGDYNNSKEMKELKKCIRELSNQVDHLKKEIEKIRKN